MKRTAGGGGGDGLTQGEIIQVQGGHIVRATGRKDRHSKVYTSKGPRDRRVRLSAHTAIQFYDVQDRLGYDRPSKAVDWLIKKAKNAIDKLAQVSQPPNPNEITMAAAAAARSSDSNPGSGEPSSSVYAIQNQHLHENLNCNRGGSAIIPPTHSIAETMKSFFPVSPGNSLMNMQNFQDERMSRQPLQNEDLGLSLHTLQDHQIHHRSYTEQMLFSGGSNNPTMFQTDYHHHHPQKTESWSGDGGGGGDQGENRNNNIGFIFNPHSLPQQIYFSQSSSPFSHQREPLQSNSYSNLLHVWNERQMLPSVEHHSTATTQPNFNQSSFYNFHFGSDFQVPARIRGEEDPGGVVSLHHPSSVSPSSQH